jgi:hypothetical protein
MFRFLVTAILLLGTKAFCVVDFAIADLGRPSKVIELIDSQPSVGYVGCGNMHLLLKDFELALRDFQRAEAYLYRYPYPLVDPSPGVECMIHFGRAVAYDNLGLSDKCSESIGRILLLVSKNTDYDDDSEDSDENEEEDKDPVYKAVCEASHLIFRRIAETASTEEVKKFLLSIVEGFEKTDKQVKQKEDGAKT